VAGAAPLGDDGRGGGLGQEDLDPTAGGPGTWYVGKNIPPMYRVFCMRVLRCKERESAKRIRTFVLIQYSTQGGICQKRELWSDCYMYSSPRRRGGRRV